MSHTAPCTCGYAPVASPASASACDASGGSKSTSSDKHSTANQLPGNAQLPGELPRPHASGLAGSSQRTQHAVSVTSQDADGARDRRLGRDMPEDPGSDRTTAASARQSPPNASVTARSVRTLPGSWTAVGLRHRDIDSFIATVTSAAVVNSTPPAEPIAATGAELTRTDG